MNQTATDRNNLTEDQIVEAATKYFEREGKWPTGNSGGERLARLLHDRGLKALPKRVQADPDASKDFGSPMSWGKVSDALKKGTPTS